MRKFRVIGILTLTGWLAGAGLLAKQLIDRYDLIAGYMDLVGGNADGAIDHLTQALRSGRLTDAAEQRLAYRLRGTEYYRKRSYDEAVADYGMVIQLMPDDPGAYYTRASINYDAAL